jgi:hypothetical protein
LRPRGIATGIIQLEQASMESITAFDAKTRLSELLDRAANGETFEHRF